MLTDAPRKTNHAGFLESDHLGNLELPQNGKLIGIASSLESAMKEATAADVRRACGALMTELSDFYQVPECGIRVLAARPLRVREKWTSELFGDYTPDTMQIRVWMRTAVRKDVTSFGTFLSTLCHEFCHHLDFQKFGFSDSWHTRGFYERAGALYHCARNSAEASVLDARTSWSLANQLATDQSRWMSRCLLTRQTRGAKREAVSRTPQRACGFMRWKRIYVILPNSDV
jgi:hypothetical protein